LWIAHNHENNSYQTLLTEQSYKSTVYTAIFLKNVK